MLLENKYYKRREKNNEQQNKNQQKNCINAFNISYGVLRNRYS